MPAAAAAVVALQCSNAWNPRSRQHAFFEKHPPRVRYSPATVTLLQWSCAILQWSCICQELQQHARHHRRLTTEQHPAVLPTSTSSAATAALYPATASVEWRLTPVSARRLTVFYACLSVPGSAAAAASGLFLSSRSASAARGTSAAAAASALRPL